MEVEATRLRRAIIASLTIRVLLPPATNAPQVISRNVYNNSADYDEGDGRAYIRAVSEIITDPNQTCNGKAKSNAGEARMDIEHSEMSYLGFHDGESYGLTWKV